MLPPSATNPIEPDDLERLVRRRARQGTDDALPSGFAERILHGLRPLETWRDVWPLLAGASLLSLALVLGAVLSQRTGADQPAPPPVSLFQPLPENAPFKLP